MLAKNQSSDWGELGSRSAEPAVCPLRRRKFARSALRNRSARKSCRSFGAFSVSFCIRFRCQKPRVRASRLTMRLGLRIGPPFGEGCCSSVVERVIGNDEVGSSILPSSTTKSSAVPVERDACATQKMTRRASSAVSGKVRFGLGVHSKCRLIISDSLSDRTTHSANVRF
jgi:hypothetical protein